jgi:hypothetical protein
MTLDLMTEQVKAELAALSPEAKLELMALIRNRAAVVVGNSELSLMNNEGFYAGIAKHACMQMVDEISALLKEKE